jgi:hypothetical protein
MVALEPSVSQSLVRPDSQNESFRAHFYQRLCGVSTVRYWIFLGRSNFKFGGINLGTYVPP